MKETGQVIEALPNSLYRVQFEDGKILICYPSGKIQYNHIKIIIGDKVEVLIDPYGGKATNRITKRLKN